MNNAHNLGKARAAILEELKRRFKEGDKSVKCNERWSSPCGEEDRGLNYFSGQGEMTCPICGTGKLRYSRSSYNGHVHAGCSTGNCVRWME